MNFKRLAAVISLALLSWAGLFGYTRIVQVNQGGTGASTAAGARDGILWPSAGSIACASPCTPAAGVTTVTVAGTTTINLPALSTYANGQRLLVVCDSASTCPVTFDPSDSGTCDGGSAGAACASITVLAHGTVGAIRTGASTWGSVQPGALSPNGFRWYVGDGSVWFLATHTLGNGTTIDLSAPLQATDIADPLAQGATLSGDTITWPNGGVGTNLSIPTRAQYWGTSLASLGLTYPSGEYNVTYQTSWGAESGTRGGTAVDVAMLTSVGGYATIQRGVGVNLGTTGTSKSHNWLTSTSAGLFATVSGSATANRTTQTVVQLTSVTQANSIQRYNASVYVSDYAGSNGNNTTSQFTHAALWTNIGLGPKSGGSLSLAGLSGTVRWTATN